MRKRDLAAWVRQFALAIVICLVSIEQAHALSCAVQSSLDAPNAATPDDVSRFLLESKQSVKGSELVAIGKITALSEAVSFEWYASRRADIQVERYFRKPATSSAGTVLLEDSYPVFIPANGFNIGQRVLVFASPEPELHGRFRRNELNRADKVGGWPLRMWLAQDVCWRGIYAEGSKNYQTLIPVLSAWQNNKDAPGELILERRGDNKVLGVKIQSLDGTFAQNFRWETPTLQLPAGKYTVTWPVQAGWGFSCFFDKPSTQRCEFEIEPGLPTEVLGRYTDYPEPILRLLDSDGKPLLTTASLKWYGDGDAVKGLSARLEGLGDTISDYPLTQLALTATWRASDEVISDTSQCKKFTQQLVPVPASELAGNRYRRAIDMKPGISIYRTRIDPTAEGWFAVRFEGKLLDYGLLISAPCEPELNLAINQLPATIFVPRGQTIGYKTELYVPATKLLINAATTINLRQQNENL